MCANGRTVREQFEIVATENYDILDEIMHNFGKNNCMYSNEETVVQLEPNTQRLPVGRVIEITMTGIQVGAMQEKTSRGNDTETTNTHHGARRTETTYGKNETYKEMYDQDGNPKVDADGNIIDQRTSIQRGNDVSRQSPSLDRETKTKTYGDVTKTSDSTYQFKAYLYVQLVPYVLTPAVVEGYITANFSPPISKRWTKYKAGEISFWRDFVLARDLIKKQAKILKQDKHGVILDMMQRQKGALWAWWKHLFESHFAGGNMSHNLANTILISSKATFDRTCRESRINFNDNNQRQKFFNKTWSMIVCVVDPLYNTVEMYFNGVNMKGTYSFAMINKVGAKGQDNFDLKEVMSAFSQGLTPKF